jgi:hypothetical protein
MHNMHVIYDDTYREINLICSCGWWDVVYDDTPEAIMDQAINHRKDF